MTRIQQVWDMAMVTFFEEQLVFEHSLFLRYHSEDGVSLVEVVILDNSVHDPRGWTVVPNSLSSVPTRI